MLSVPGEPGLLSEEPRLRTGDCGCSGLEKALGECKPNRSRSSYLAYYRKWPLLEQPNKETLMSLQTGKATEEGVVRPQGYFA